MLHSRVSPVFGVIALSIFVALTIPVLKVIYNATRTIWSWRIRILPVIKVCRIIIHTIQIDVFYPILNSIPVLVVLRVVTSSMRHPCRHIITPQIKPIFVMLRLMYNCP